MNEILQGYGINEHVAEAVAETAEEFNHKTLQEHLHDMPAKDYVASPTGYDLYEMRFEPKVDYDNSRALGLWLPIAHKFSPMMKLRAAAIAAANPEIPLVVWANRALGFSEGDLSPDERAAVRENDWSRVADRFLPRLAVGKRKGENIRISTAGASLGADIASEMSAHAARHDLEVEHGIFMDPIRVVNRGFIKIYRDFIKSGQGLDDYIRESQMEAMIKAQHLDQPIRRLGGMLLYVTGNLAFKTNRAYVNSMGYQDGYENAVRKALARHPKMKIISAHGQKSTMAVDERMQEIDKRLIESFGSERVSSYTVHEGSHAWTDNVWVQAAMIRTALQKPPN